MRDRRRAAPPWAADRAPDRVPDAAARPRTPPAAPSGSAPTRRPRGAALPGRVGGAVGCTAPRLGPGAGCGQIGAGRVGFRCPRGRAYAHRVGRLRLSPDRYHRLCRAALVALVGIVVTGAAVRLTGSGLGCTDWPTCSEERLVAPLELAPMIEFVNRLITGVVSLAVIAAVAGALARVPRRADLVWLALGLVAGVVAQVLLGAALVLADLDPRFTIGHFLLSAVLVGNAVVLVHRAGSDLAAGLAPLEGATAAAPVAARRVATALVAMGAAVLVSGTVVTGAGPHGGDDRAARLNLDVADVARIHSLLVW